MRAQNALVLPAVLVLTALLGGRGYPALTLEPAPRPELRQRQAPRRKREPSAARRAAPSALARLCHQCGVRRKGTP